MPYWHSASPNTIWGKMSSAKFAHIIYSHFVFVNYALIWVNNYNCITEN